MVYVDIERVVSDGLCHRCGGCRGICPAEAIRFEKDMYPVIDREKCIRCAQCVAICSGHGVCFAEHLPRFGASIFDTTRPLGAVTKSFAAHATNPSVRSRGSSGGVVTGILLGLLDEGKIDGAVVVGGDAGTPLDIRAEIAWNEGTIKRCTQSKYVVTPVLHTLKQVLDSGRRIALVGLPCQMHTLEKWKTINRRVEECVVLTIGLVCHMNLERNVLPILLGVKGIRPEEVEGIEFRGGEWPGGMRVKLRDGSMRRLHSLNIKDGAFNYLNKLFVSERCLYCIDFACEMADISVSDPWIRDGKGKYLYPGGWSLVHTRTARGADVVQDLAVKRKINIEDIDGKMCEDAFRSPAFFKKRGAFLRAAGRGRRGKASPSYDVEEPVIPLKEKWRYTVRNKMFLPPPWRKWLQRPLTRVCMSLIGTTLALAKIALRRAVVVGFWTFHHNVAPVKWRKGRPTGGPDSREQRG